MSNNIVAIFHLNLPMNIEPVPKTTVDLCLVIFKDYLPVTQVVHDMHKTIMNPKRKKVFGVGRSCPKD